jgi:beta-lactam-binding protein with PASTA domain
VGKPFVEVYNSLMRKGLKPEISFYDVFDIDNGIVLNQHPDSGSIVTEGSKLKLVVSRSSLFIDIPNVVGIELPFAINKLKNLHIYNKSVSLGLGVISYIPSDKSAENIVMDQSPRAGEKVTPDRKINLLVSAGKTDAGMKMPSLEGQSIDLCLDLLLAKGLSVSFDVADTGTRDQSGNVFAQDPPKDAAVKRGDNVRLKVHYYPLKNHPYHAYEKMEYTAPADEKGGLYEAYIEDDHPRRIAYSRSMKPGEKLSFVFHRAGNARVKILCDKKAVKVMKIDVEEFD